MESAQQSLKIKLFGRFEVWRDERLVSSERLPRGKTQTLLKVLLTKRGIVLTQDQLIEYLYPDLDPESAIKNLVKRVSELRKALEPRRKRGIESQYVLSIGQESYSFNEKSVCWLDTEEFEKHIKTAQESEKLERWDEALQSYQKALELYTGEYLSEDLDEIWVQAQREHWREQYVKALARAAECHARLGQYAEAIERCQQASKVKPTNEGIYRQRMLYHHLNQEQNEALQIYRDCVKVLKEELGVEPSDATRELSEEITQKKVQGIEVYPRSRTAAHHNLPTPITSFIGREREIVRVKWLLQTSRLVTLTGPGGSGKTRLALQVASSLLKEYTDGVWWVNLSTLADPALVHQIAAMALGVREETNRPLMASLTHYLQRKNLLVILDNCEHLIEACAWLTQTLLSSCAQLRILATSREALALTGESVWQVPPLAMPEPSEVLPSLKVLRQYEAVSLFIERARAGHPSFAFSAENARPIVKICHHLDGIPLAIELAAARVRVLSAEQVAERLSDRFKLLTGGNRAAEPRQQTLRAALDWSHDLLSEKEKILLRRLAIFEGGWTLEAAEAICAGEGVEKHDVLASLARLVEKSFVIARVQGQRARYDFLKTIRQYSLEKLQEAGELRPIRLLHLDYFLHLAEEAEPQMVRSEQKTWLDRLEAEHGNLREALAWCQSEKTEIEKGMRLVGALWWFWWIHGYFSEGRSYLESLLMMENTKEHKRSRAKALNGAGSLAYMQGDYKMASRFYREGLEIHKNLGNVLGTSQVLNGLGLVAMEQGDYEAARLAYGECLTINRNLHNKTGIAAVLNNLGKAATAQGDYAAALSFYEESLSIKRELRDRKGIAGTMHNLGELEQGRGNYAKATTLFREALIVNRELGNRVWEASNCWRLGEIALLQGEHIRAQELYRKSLAVFHELGDKKGVVESLRGFADLAVARAEFEKATRLLSAAEMVRESINLSLQPTERTHVERIMAMSRTHLGEERFEKSWDAGRAMPLEEAIRHALQENK